MVSWATARRGLWRAARLVLLAYLVVILLLTLFENSLVYFPSRYPSGDWSLAADVEDAWFVSADGTKLHGWYLPAQQPQAVVLFLHGNGGSIAGRRGLLEVFRRMNVSGMLFSYRGYGRSEGQPNEIGILADARAARSWLAKRAGAPESQVVLWGESLGGAVAVDLAAEGARGLILENTFTSIRDVAAFHYAWLPVRLLMKHKLDSLSKIARYKGPLLQFHGDADTIVPYELGKRLFEAANEPKTFVTLRRADHNDPRSKELVLAVRKFIDDLPPP